MKRAVIEIHENGYVTVEVDGVKQKDVTAIKFEAKVGELPRLEVVSINSKLVMF